jgi:hypothetical protein
MLESFKWIGASGGPGRTTLGGWRSLPPCIAVVAQTSAQELLHDVEVAGCRGRRGWRTGVAACASTILPEARQPTSCSGGLMAALLFVRFRRAALRRAAINAADWGLGRGGEEAMSAASRGGAKQLTRCLNIFIGFSAGVWLALTAAPSAAADYLEPSQVPDAPPGPGMGHVSISTEPGRFVIVRIIGRTDALNTWDRTRTAARSGMPPKLNL